MLKIIISVYIAAILLMAGFAEASVASDFQRIRKSAKILLPVEAAKFDPENELLTLSGKVDSSCISTVSPELLFDQRLSSVLVGVSAQGESCFSNEKSYYEIVIDVKAFFAENSLNRDSLVNFHIDNFTGADNFSFEYFAKQQIRYVFDVHAHGTIEIDHRTKKFYLIGRGSRTEVLSRIDLNNYVNKFVQLKGLTPSSFSIGENSSPSDSKLIVGQITALR